MNKSELQNKLHEAYKSETWEEIISFVFPNVSYIASPQEIIANSDKIESLQQIASIRTHDNKNIALFHAKVSENVNIPRNRVELRKTVENFIDQEKAHAVLAIFEQGSGTYRFSFITKMAEYNEDTGDVETTETDKKRYTYVMGKTESCRTPRDRFWEVHEKKSETTLKDIEEAFSVERLNKEFFNKYKEHYENFVQYITGKRFVKQKGKWIEKQTGESDKSYNEVFNAIDKDTRNFIKLLLGRLIFIQFLQKKGWMGVPAENKKWEGGELFFTHDYYKNCTNKDIFYSKYLYPLFYQAFNTPNRENDIFELTKTRIPYLNGGLFEENYKNTDKIDFPPKLFDDLFEFFKQYNFTIDENDTNDHEIGIDPEMLGHIFENLLEDNKDKGAFYTPKPIVQYMGQESLIQYLKTKLDFNSLNEAETTKIYADLEAFVKNKTAADLLNKYATQLAVALRDIKICDPAIGSGAFPMGLLTEIFRCMDVLYHASPDEVGEIWKMKEWNPGTVKKNIIQNSIYGVDIEKGAVDIARLRFWLSLIVDENEPTPLPNLDYKIMQGNSLLESFEGIDLSNIGKTTGEKVYEPARDLFGNIIDAQMDMTFIKNESSEKTQTLIKKYFSENRPTEKQQLKKEIENIIHEHIEFNIDRKEKSLNRRISEAGNPEKLKAKAKKDLEKLKIELIDVKKAKQKLEEIQLLAEKPYFLWHLFFKDVFDDGGFDIVIGNPPYIQLQKEGGYLAKLYEKQNFKSFARMGDIYALFYEDGINHLKENGVLSFITSNKWMRAGYGKSLRKFFSEKKPVKLIDLGANVFETATVDTNILFVKNAIAEKHKIEAITLTKRTITTLKNSEFTILKDISENSWVILSPIEQQIKEKIERIGTPLKDWDINIYRGVLTGYNEAFIIDGKTKDKLIEKDPKSAVRYLILFPTAITVLSKQSSLFSV